MDIKEIIEKINSGEISQNKLAKEVLGIPEGTLRSQIKAAGYHRNEERKYVLADPSKAREKIRENASNNKIKNSSINNNNNAIMDNKNKNKNKNKDDDMELEIQALIKGTNKEESNRIYKGVYLDKDIAHFLDTIQHGNKSEVINKIIRKYLLDNDLI
jgi:hypothetical protein